MKCFKCGAEAPVGNKFCPRCGASMSVGQTGGAGVPQIVNENHNKGRVNPINQDYPNLEYSNGGYQNPGYPNGGYPMLGYPNGGYPMSGGSSATASMILGIVSDILMVIGLAVAFSSAKTFLTIFSYTDITMLGMGVIFIFVSVVCAIIGFILGFVGLKTPKKGKAIAGLICNGLIVILALIGLFSLL